MGRVSMVELSFGKDVEREVLGVLRSGRIAQGPKVEQLEAEFAAAVGTRHGVAVSSGTAALRLALEASGIGEGDLVVVPALTFAATLNAVLEVGATALLVDVDRHGNLAIGGDANWTLEDVAAVVPVHLYGRPLEMGVLMRAAEAQNWAVVEDAAQAIGAMVDGRSVGSFGLGSFSLYATKNITTGEGGIITTDDEAIADIVRSLRAQGSPRRYEYDRVGFNYRLTDLQAAIGIPQMRRLDEITKARNANAEGLTAGLEGIEGLVTPSVAPGSVHAFHQYTVRITPAVGVTRDEVAVGLDADGIDSTVVYPRPLHGYQVYREHPRVVATHTPMADRLSSEVLSLPVHPSLTDADLDRIVSSLWRQLG